MLSRFAGTMVRRRRAVVVAWLVAVVVVTVLSSSFGGEHRVDYSMPGSEAAEAQRLLAERFPEMSGDSVQLVFHAVDGVQSDAAAATITDVSAAAARVDRVTGVQAPVVSTDGTVALATVQLDATAEKVPMTTIRELMTIAREADRAEMAVEIGGAAVQNAEGSEAGSEQIGMVAALVILLIAFGSLLAAGIPIVVALFGVGAALAAVPLLNNVLMIPEWATGLVTMICIGIGIDYALFIVTRYRAGLDDGLAPADAVVAAVTTAGRAVLFAGGTVVISLLGLCAMGLEYLYGTAGAMVLGVLVVLVASMTLLPALLGFAGRSIDRLHHP
jgi:RND superfamily putative drug exporter